MKIQYAICDDRLYLVLVTRHETLKASPGTDITDIVDDSGEIEVPDETGQLYYNEEAYEDGRCPIMPKPSIAPHPDFRLIPLVWDKWTEV